MSVWKVALGTLGILTITGCGTIAQGERTRAPSHENASNAALPCPTPLSGRTTWVGATDNRMASRAFAGTAVLFQDEGSILIGEKAPPPEPSRPKRHKKVDVSFHKADLENALRFLSDAGKFNLVVESGLTGSVTAELHGVDAFDALVLFAEANGAQAHFSRGIVMVKKVSPPR